MPWNTVELLEFLVNAQHATYDRPEERRVKNPHRPGFEEFFYISGDWRYLDSSCWNYKGGGEEIVYYEGKPIWMMNYYGFLLGRSNRRTIFTFLRQALRRRHRDLPIRGTNLINHLHNMRYQVDFDRKDLTCFRGKEYIYQDESLVYECFFHGGIIE